VHISAEEHQSLGAHYDEVAVDQNSAATLVGMLVIQIAVAVLAAEYAKIALSLRSVVVS
jgi:uncharacterized membrane protein